MNSRPFHHALTVKEQLCRGCTRCMKNCPTEAIRIIHGKASVNPALCIDCGQCMDACPYSAIVVEQDDFAQIYSFKERVAILPSVFIGQFADDIPETFIYQTLRDIGFTSIYEAEFGVDILKTIGNKMSLYAENKPVISSYCPAIVRLIQLKYPSLVLHVNLLRPPVEITALYIRKKLMQQGVLSEDIGVFYVTPCAAKIASVKTPQSSSDGLFDGVINMDYLYNLVQAYIAKHKKQLKETSQNVPIPPLTPSAGLWSLTTGESSTVSGRALAVDEIHNVIEFLEKLENDEISNIDFLELRACAEGCAGGILTPGNRFLAAERLHHRSRNMHALTSEQKKEIMKRAEYLQQNLKVDTIEPKQSHGFDPDLSQAIKKIDRARKILDILPGIDCGLCGAPTCKAFSEDIARSIALEQDPNSRIRQCTVLSMRRYLPTDSPIRKVWGKKFEAN